MQTNRVFYPGRQSREIPLTSATNTSVHDHIVGVEPMGEAPLTPALHNFNSPYYKNVEKSDSDYSRRGQSPVPAAAANGDPDPPLQRPRPKRYTSELQERPALTFIQQLRPWNGRLHQDKWLRVAVRPFVLFAYPAVLWSSVVYACSIGNISVPFFLVLHFPVLKPVLPCIFALRIPNLLSWASADSPVVF